MCSGVIAESQNYTTANNRQFVKTYCFLLSLKWATSTTLTQTTSALAIEAAADGDKLPIAFQSPGTATLASLPTNDQQQGKNRKDIQQQKQFRATLIMFSSVAAVGISYGPLFVANVCLRFGFDVLQYVPGDISIFLTATAPLLDPFAYALTLPKLRARAKKSPVGQAMNNLYSLITKKKKNSLKNK